MRRYPSIAGLSRSIFVTAAIATLCSNAFSAEPNGVLVRDPHYGEVLFHFYQQDYFTALTHLAAFREQKKFSHHADEAELLQGGLLLSWGQHEEAGRIFEQLLANADDPSVRNRTWFYLGKIRYQRGHIEAAEDAFESISAPLPEELDAERYNLLARIYMDQGRFKAAADLLGGWEGKAVWAVYARYNLGVAMVRMGELEAGAELLNSVGAMSFGANDNDELLSLRDRANVALGFAYLQEGSEIQAKEILQRVRLTGPFSNKALLGVGWADSASQDYRKALVPWLELSQRDLLDSAVQESLLAVPYAMAKLDSDPVAAQYYVRALQIFESEIQRIDSAIADAAGGRLVNTLLKDDEFSSGGWSWQLENIPDDNRTRYLYFAIADHRFHEGLKSYRDLIALNRGLYSWGEKLDTFSNMLETLEVAYADRLPETTRMLASDDLHRLRDTYNSLQARASAAVDSHDVVSFAPEVEQAQWHRLISLEGMPGWDSEAASDLRDKQRLLKGLLMWEMEKEYKVRAWRQERALQDLAKQLELAEQSYAALENAEAAVPGNVGDFDRRISALSPRIALMRAQLASAMEKHIDYLHQIAARELNSQKDRLMSYRAQARFALASIYDRLSARAE
jgi:tetratricopeptide (TPR) repeat protein